MSGAYPLSETRILVVEDEAIVARDLAQRLEGLGYSVTGTAGTGAEALALAEKTRPNLVFMDITIQGPIDGVETAQRIASRMDVPIIFLTAHTDTGTILRARQARPYGYLVKPLEERELLTTIEMAVSRHKSDLPARLLEQAIANAGVGMVMVSALGPSHQITMCNAAFERMSGYSLSEILGRSPWFLEGQEAASGTDTRLRHALTVGKECQVNCEIHRKDGSTLRSEVALSAVRNSSGEATHFLICLTRSVRD